MFKRRDKRSYSQLLTESVYPRGGWRRAAYYVQHRLQRLPDEPHRIARGVFAGVFISFTPLFGFHFLGAALIAWVLRGNILAALLATFVGNPLTTPIIAVSSIELGHWMLGTHVPFNLMTVFEAFSSAGMEITHNLAAIFTAEPTRWHKLEAFFTTIFLPYLVGGILPGIAVSFIFYYLTIPVIRAYQIIRAKQAGERKRRRLHAKHGGPAESRSALLPQDDGTGGRP